MSVDNYAAAIALTEKIKASLPITVRPGKEFLKLLKKQGKQYSSMTVDSVLYMGDEGGIGCGIQAEDDSKEVHLVSITHLEVDPTHPLAAEIQEYQRQRVRALKIQNSRGFLGEMNRLSAAAEQKKKKGDRGFGK